MNTATKLRARVSPEAIAKVTRIFNGSLDDIFNELLQNARRAGATAIAITAMNLGDASVITISDDGAGIDDPENLVSLGQSDWPDECRAREDPAGMGFFSLAGRDTLVRSAGASSSFSLAITGPAWTGGADIDVLPWQGPRGTTISFTFEAIGDSNLEQAVKVAARHFPLPVTCNGELMPQIDFLEGAYAVIEQEGYRIGVFKNTSLDHVPTINFHGVTIKHSLASIREVHRRSWGVKVDIIDAPELALVLPARKEICRNAALEHLAKLCNAAIFASIRAEPFHRLSHKDWLAACSYIGDFPEAVSELPPWRQICGRDCYRETPDYISVCETAAIYRDDDAFDSVTLERAIIVSHGEDSGIDANRILIPQDISFYSPVPQYAGYNWYDRLSCFERIGEAFRQLDGSETSSEADPATFRPDTIVLNLADQHGRELQLESDFAILDCEDYWNDPDEIRIALTRRSKIDPGHLTDLIIEAAFSPSDDNDSDSYETQESRFRHDAVVRAHAILEGEDAATIAGIRMAFGDRIAWRIPHGRTLQLSWSSERASLELLPANDAKVT